MTQLAITSITTTTQREFPFSLCFFSEKLFDRLLCTTLNEITVEHDKLNCIVHVILKHANWEFDLCSFAAFPFFPLGSLLLQYRCLCIWFIFFNFTQEGQGKRET